jgi:hypothetical protein
MSNHTETTGHRTCLCRLCARNRQILMVRNYGNAAAKRLLIDDLWNDLDHAEFDNDYWQAICSGSWPGARQIAENIIRRCDENVPKHP